MQITLGTDEKTSSRSFLWKETFETRAHFAPCFIRKFAIGPKKSVQFGEVTKTSPSTRYFEWRAKESPGKPGQAQESPGKLREPAFWANRGWVTRKPIFAHLHWKNYEHTFVRKTRSKNLRPC